MRKIYIFQLLAVITLFSITLNKAIGQAGECTTAGACTFTNTFQYPAATQSTTSPSFVSIAADSWAGDYAVCNVTSGTTYEWSLCPADGGVSTFDAQLTLFNGTTNALLCYSDDVCGTAPKITWVATYTGTVKLQLNEYDCVENELATTIRWRAFTAIANDAAVSNVYTLGTIATPYINPHQVRAQITNTGTTSMANLVVSLNVTGANTFSNTQTITNLASGASTMVTFAGYNSLVTGTNTVTVSIPSDANPANNSVAVSQTVNTDSYNYAYGTTSGGGAGFQAAANDIAVKFNTSSATSISSVKVNFNTAGNAYKVKIWSATGAGGIPGTVLYTSATLTTAVGVSTVAISPAVSVNGNFYVALEQAGATNFNCAYQSEVPLRVQTFYYGASAGTGWTDLSTAGLSFRVMLEPVFSCATPVAPASITGETSVCPGSTQTYTAAAVTGATSYAWTLPNGWTGSSTTSSIVSTVGVSGGNITVTATTPCGTTTATTLAVSIGSAPATPGTITGSNAICGSSSQTYSIASVAGATSYTWTLPGDWTGTSTTNSITASVGSAGGNVTVTATNSCGTSTASTLAVSVTPIASTPGTITGNNSVCSATSQTYSIVAVAGATSYTWTLPGDWTGSSTTNSITTTAGSNSGDITVTASNSCGTSSAQVISVSVNGSAPAQPGSISGETTACSFGSQTYSVSAVTGATSYTWTMPGGWTGTSLTNSITVVVGTTGGDVEVIAENGCGVSTSQTLAVAVNTSPVQPGAITGETTICDNGVSTQTYSIDAVAGATSYTWTLPGGWLGSSTSNSITATPGTGGGDITVTADNSICNSPAQTLSVTIADSPAQPGAISGTMAVCEGSSHTFNIDAVAGATSYMWTLPSGWSGTSVSNSIGATAGTTGGSITVTASNTCGTSTAQSAMVTVNPNPATPVISSVSGNVLTSSSATGNQWSFAGNDLSGETGQNHTAANSGIYNVTVTDGNGCSATSADYNHIITGIKKVGIEQSISLFPNPTRDIVNISLNDNKNIEAVFFTNILGKTVKVIPVSNFKESTTYSFDSRELGAGVYFLTIQSEGKTSTKKLIVQ